MSADLHEVEIWLEESIYKDEDGRRRQIHWDYDQDRLFFFSDPLDFDKDDTRKPARYWLDELEGYDPEWEDVLLRLYTV